MTALSKKHLNNKFLKRPPKNNNKMKTIKDCIETFEPHRILSQSMDMLFSILFIALRRGQRIEIYLLVYNIFPVFSKSCVKVSVCSSHIKFVVAGACHCLTVLFCLRLYYSYCYLFCRLFLSTFLLIHCPVR